MIQNIKKKNIKNIECSLELKELNECIKNNKIDKIDCNKLFYDYIKCNELNKLGYFHPVGLPLSTGSTCGQAFQESAKNILKNK